MVNQLTLPDRVARLFDEYERREHNELIKGQQVLAKLLQANPGSQPDDHQDNPVLRVVLARAVAYRTVRKRLKEQLRKTAQAQSRQLPPLLDKLAWYAELAQDALVGNVTYEPARPKNPHEARAELDVYREAIAKVRAELEQERVC